VSATDTRQESFMTLIPGLIPVGDVDAADHDVLIKDKLGHPVTRE
jgi:hypothetical protein